MPQLTPCVKTDNGACLDGGGEGGMVGIRGGSVMRGTILLALAVLVMLLPPLSAAAGPEERSASLERLERHKAAELELWRSMETMSLRQGLLVSEEPSSYGAYTPREDNRFRRGDPIIIYAEPVGHTIREENGLYRISLTADYALLDGTGTLLAGQRDIGNWEMESRRPVMEFMIFFTYDFSDFPTGAYTLETVVNDAFSDRSLKIDTPIVIVGEPVSPSP